MMMNNAHADVLIATYLSSMSVYHSNNTREKRVDDNFSVLCTQP